MMASFVCDFILSFVLANFIIWTGADTFAWGALTGLIVWIGFFVAPNLPQSISKTVHSGSSPSTMAIGWSVCPSSAASSPSGASAGGLKSGHEQNPRCDRIGSRSHRALFAGRPLRQSDFTAGQIALDPATGQLVPGGIAEQTTRVLENLKAILQAAGGRSGQSRQGHRLPERLQRLRRHERDLRKVSCSRGSRRAGTFNRRSLGRLPKDALVEIEFVAEV